MAGKGKLLEEIHPVDIIHEVQKWPALYRKDGSERANAHLKNKIWNEIAKSLFPDWDSFPEYEKISKVTDLTKRWRNLKDTFKKQLSEKKSKSGQLKKKKYVYFKHLSFLLPHIAANDGSQEESQPRHGNTQDGTDSEGQSTTSYACEQHIDEDKHFLLSLVPSFKRMTDEEKLTAKVDILNVIKSVRSRAGARSRRPEPAGGSLACDVTQYVEASEFAAMGTDIGIKEEDTSEAMSLSGGIVYEPGSSTDCD
ncbi:uncharacterized protein LOC113513401 [Galleria mellonella]|uniref:Uncharacterized protein LOC113513401 n=1 Tax=Galleria mellonella TaxID=7137 RepID=A0ABM3MVM1_GALME|nr:uncharacterized protein LOC113513401 [Galleria mellonella]